jgi:16S rRNA (adenine1518-N6/adenine1519-N6)-dimethyltransferase
VPEEHFDVVDEADRVIGQRPRSVVHRDNLLHRAVHVFVFDSRGRLLVQLRSAFKDQFPSTWTSSASGHLAAGEDYEPAARRELEEELGLVAPLEFLVKLPACAATAWEHTALYRTTTDAVPRCDPQEIERVESVALDEVERRIAADPARHSPCFVELVRWYRAAHPA